MNDDDILLNWEPADQQYQTAYQKEVYDTDAAFIERIKRESYVLQKAAYDKAIEEALGSPVVAEYVFPERLLTNQPSDNFTISFVVKVKRGDKRGEINEALVREALVTLANAYMESESIKALDNHPMVIDTIISAPWRD